MSTLPKPFAFVLMPFDSAFDDVYKLGIKPACEDAGYYCERLDEQIFEETMLDRIYNQIAKADLVVADLSGRNPNVFYETGYAHALNKRAILLTKNPEDIPFDLKHHFHIIYSQGISHLKQELCHRAKYYLASPSETNIDPFKVISIIANGTALNIDSNRSSVGLPMNSNLGERFLSLSLSVHISGTESREAVEIKVRLITSDEFRICRNYSLLPNLVYDSIEMLDGRVLHNPKESLKVYPSDPAKMVFDLPFYSSNEFSGCPMALRFISKGQIKDVEFMGFPRPQF